MMTANPTATWQSPWQSPQGLWGAQPGSAPDSLVGSYIGAGMGGDHTGLLDIRCAHLGWVLLVVKGDESFHRFTRSMEW